MIFKKNNYKKWLSLGLIFSTSLSFLVSSIPIKTNSIENNNSHLSIKTINNDLKATGTTNTTMVPGLTNINNFASYEPIYYSVSHQLVSTSIGFLGMSKDNKTIILTSYSGLVVWSNNVVETQIVKDFLASFNVTDLTSYSVTSWLKLDNNYLAVLLSSTNTGNPSVSFSLNLNTGEIYAPKLDNQGVPTPTKNLVKVSSTVNTLVASASANSYYALPMGVSIANAKNNVYQITISDQGISGLQLSNLSISDDETEIVVSAVGGSIGSSKNFLFTHSSTTSKIYIYVLNDQFTNYLKTDKTKERYEIANKTFTLTNNTQDGLLTKIPRQGFFVGNRNVNSSIVNMLVPLYGTTKQTSGFVGLSYANNNMTTIDYSSYMNSSGVETPSVVFVDGTKAFYSTSQTSINTLIGNIDLTNINNPVFSNVKQATTDSQKAKPWKFIPVSNENGVAYLYIDTSTSTTTSTTIKREFLSGSTWSNPVDITFNKYNDPVTTIKNHAVYKAKLVTSITDAELASLFTFSNNNIRNNYTISITNRTNDAVNGVLKFTYKIDSTAWWNSSKKVSFTLSVNIDGFYQLSKIKLWFVNSQSVDETKFNQVVELKKTKYADEITKQNVLDYFVKSEIIDKDGNTLNLTESMITLVPSKDKDQLTVTVQLPADKFPTGITSFSSIIKQTYTFDGFLSLSGYDFTINNNGTTFLKSKFPSEVVFEDIINEVVNLGNAYSKSKSDWTCDFTHNDLDGTITINELKYTKQLTQTIPENKLNIITSPMTISGLKNTIALFERTPSISTIPKNQTIGKTPVSIWEEYKTALDSNDQTQLEKTLIYRSLSNNITLNKSDIVLKATNLDTANKEGILRYEATIKKDATLLYKLGTKNLTFSTEYESKLKEVKPDFYPFQLSQKIDIEIYNVNWNSSTTSNLNNLKFDNDDNVVIDLDISEWNGITNGMTASSFVNNYENYKEKILSLFSYTPSYKPNILPPTFNSKNNSVLIEVEFVPTISIASSKALNVNKKSNTVETVSKSVRITGFKLEGTFLFEVITIVASVFAVLILLILLVFIFIRTRHNMNLKTDEISKPTVKENKKYLGYKKVIVETPTNLGFGKKMIIKEELINNKKKTSNKKIDINKNKNNSRKWI